VLVNDGRDLQRFSRGTRVAGFLLSGLTTTYAFRLYEDGVECRYIRYVDWEITIDSGRPLPEEADLPEPALEHDDLWIFTLLERITGVTYTRMEAHRFMLASFG
jgi:hypothetical protein